ncbi:hypothetical protein KNO81_12300 [Paraburkholderia sediminicola]|nr:hypothetical protein [Paraburkholderia sediminicola]
MSNAVEVQDIKPATVPAKTIEDLIVEGSAELIVIRAIETINGVAKHFGVDYRVPLDDDRMNDVAVNLAKANHAKMQIDEELAMLSTSFAVLDERFAERTARMSVLRAGRLASDLDPHAQPEFFALAGECTAITAAMIASHDALAKIDICAGARDVARCTADLNRVEHSILMEIMAGPVDRAEHALLDAVAALRDVARIGTKHLGPDVAADYIPNPRVVELLA